MLECRIRVPVARQPALPWQPFCALRVEGSYSCYLPSMNLIWPRSTELLQFLTGYDTLRCDIDLWLFDLGVMSRDATLVLEPCTKFELSSIYRSRFGTTTIFHWPPGAQRNWRITYSNERPHYQDFFLQSHKLPAEQQSRFVNLHILRKRKNVLFCGHF